MGVDRLDAQLVISHRLHRTRAWILAHDDDVLDDAAAADCLRDLRSRADGVPLAYLVGEKEFHGLVLEVTPETLVPRPDTETLVHWALEALDGPLAERAHPAVLDLGTGSGAIAIAVAASRPASVVTATDASAEALAVAIRNAQRCGTSIECLRGDWFEVVRGRRFDLVVSNPPYIDAADPHLAALRYEPLAALTPGPDGLSALRTIVAAAPAHLRPGGMLLLEHGFDQASSVASLLHSAGFADVQSRRDLAGQPRCTGGRWPPPP